MAAAAVAARAITVQAQQRIALSDADTKLQEITSEGLQFLAGRQPRGEGAAGILYQVTLRLTHDGSAKRLKSLAVGGRV